MWYGYNTPPAISINRVNFYAERYTKKNWKDFPFGLPAFRTCRYSKAPEMRLKVCLSRPATQRLVTHPRVGPLTALAYELVIGTPERFHCGKQVASYLGLVPEERSSGDRRRLGHISKQGNVLLRFLLVESSAGHGAQSAGVAQQSFSISLCGVDGRSRR